MRLRARRLIGGALIALLGSTAWAMLRRNGSPASATPTPPASTPTVAVPPAPSARRRLARPQPGIIVLAVGLVVLAALAVGLPLTVKKWAAFVVPGGIVSLLLLLLECIFVLPRLIAPSRSPEELVGVDGLKEQERIKLADERRNLQNGVRAALLQGVAGAAVLLGLLFTWQQQQQTIAVTQQGQVGERFSRAIDQLGNDKSVDVRLGGIYELEQLARQADDRRLVIYEVLAAYIRRHSPWPPRSAGQPPETAKPSEVSALKVRAPDVQAAVTVLGRRKPQSSDPSLALDNIDLRYANLSNANLSKTNLSNTHLFLSDLSNANLSYTIMNETDLFISTLDNADLTHAYLHETNLGGAHLRKAKLNYAYLSKTVLGGASLDGAQLTKADIFSADLSKAGLSGANLSALDLRRTSLIETDLSEANLANADLRERDLVKTDLSGAKLSQANLGSTNLSQANLSGANLSGAMADSNTVWPAGFDWKSHGVQSP